MSAHTLDRSRVAQSPLLLSAWSLIAGAISMFLLGFPLASFQNQEPVAWWVPTLNALSHLLLIIGVFGLMRAGAAGRGALANVGAGLTLLGLAVLCVAEFCWMAGLGIATLFYSSATLLMMVGLIVLGAAVLRAGRWRAWYRFTPLICGLYILLILLPSFFLPAPASNYAIGLWGFCWLLLGIALRAESAREI